MKQPLPAAIALVALATSSAAFAAAQSIPAPHFAVPVAPAATLAPKAAGSTTTPGTPMASVYRAYPPSCASYPLPDKPSGPTYTATIATYSTPDGSRYFREDITATVWRLPCSSSGAAVPYNSAGEKNAMTLIRFDRAADSTTTYVLLPAIYMKQGTIDVPSVKSNVRRAVEPNTVSSQILAFSPLFTSETYVLENFPSADAGHFNFNAAFTLHVWSGLSNAQYVDINVPAYAPTQDTYPNAFTPLPLDGYIAAQYINAQRNEGLIVQVAEGYNSAQPTHRQIAFDLLTNDASDKPFWIVGNAAFDPAPGGVRSLDIPVSYIVENNANQNWGSVHLVMTSCNQLNVTFTPKADLPEGVPSISGSINYDRLLSANGMMCE